MSSQNVLGSTSEFGSADLDLRPAEIARSALWVEVQECPFCGYCASDIGSAPESVAHTLASPRYLDSRSATEPSDLARQFLRASYASEDGGASGDAGWFALNAAWVCDDENDQSGAVRCRERAVDLFRAAASAGARYGDSDAEEAALLADVLRRAGRPREAIAVCEAAVAQAERVIQSVLSYEIFLSRGGDSAAHTIEEAVEHVPPSDDQEPAPLDLGQGFRDALAFALDLHQAQARKGTRIPYVSHLLAVASLVLEDGGSEEEAMAALLHDAVEDGGGAPVLENIRVSFGEHVAGIVEGCSDTDEVPKPPWRPRKERYIEHLAGASPSVVRVSLADKLHNARALTRDLRVHGEEVWRRFKPDSDQLWYYRTLANMFERISRSPMVADLEREVDELETLAIISALKRLVAYHDLADYAYHHLIITGDDSRNYFVQFAVDKGGLFCEAVHNMYLEDENRLTSDQVGELLALGWQPPDQKEQNLYRTFHPVSDAEFREIAALARRALYDVYLTPRRQPLNLSTSWRHSDGEGSPLPAAPG